MNWNTRKMQPKIRSPKFFWVVPKSSKFTAKILIPIKIITIVYTFLSMPQRTARNCHKIAKKHRQISMPEYIAKNIYNPMLFRVSIVTDVDRWITSYVTQVFHRKKIILFPGIFPKLQQSIIGKIQKCFVHCNSFKLVFKMLWHFFYIFSSCTLYMWL